MKAWKGYEKRKSCCIPKWKDATGYRSEKVCCIPKLVKKSPACRDTPILIPLVRYESAENKSCQGCEASYNDYLDRTYYADFIFIAE